MADVFVSYSSKDQARSEAIVSFLRRQRLLVTFDRDFLAMGDAYREIIAAELERAKVVLVLWSRHSINSKVVRDEASRAARRAVLLELIVDDELDSAVPLGFSELPPLRCEWMPTGQLAPRSREALLATLLLRLQQPEGERATGAKIFISATTRDLSECRAAAVQAIQKLGHEPLVFEQLASEERGPLETSYALIAQCDVFVCIVAWRYGYVPPAYDNPGARSFVELEYRHAWTLGKPLLVYMVSPGADWPEQLIDTGAARERLKAFREELQRNHTVVYITSADEIARQLAVDLPALLEHRLDSSPARTRTPSPPSGIDPLELAWRLVVDHQAEPTLLLQMDPALVHASVEKWAAENEVPGDAVEPMYTAAVSRLRVKQADTAPSALWVAWMRATRSHLFEAEPARVAHDIPGVESGEPLPSESGPPRP